MKAPLWGCFAALVLSGCAPVEPAREPLPSARDLPPRAEPEPRTLLIPAPPPSGRRPLPALRHRCRDRRFPKLAGSWAVGCGPGGHIDRAVHLQTGQQVELEAGAEHAGVDDGLLFAPGREHGLWRLPDPTPRDPVSVISDQVIAPPILEGRRGALLVEGRVSTFEVGASHRRLRDADPLPWFPPALVGTTVYWVDGRDQDSSGLDIWGWDSEGGPPFPVVTRTGDQRHVVASASWLVWTDDDGLWLQDHAGESWLHRADTGFRAGPSVHASVACWEEREAGDIDVRCSDGLEATGPGDQGWPSRWDDRLLIRQDGMPWLIHIEPDAGEAS